MAGSRDTKIAEIIRTQALVMKACGKTVQEIVTTTGMKSSTFYELQKRATSLGYEPGAKILLEYVQGGSASAGAGTLALTPVKKVVKNTAAQAKGKGKAVDKPIKPESDSDDDDLVDKKEKKEEKVAIKPELMEEDFEDEEAI